MAQRNPARLSDDELHADWVIWIERAYDEAVRQAWRHRMFRLMRGIATQNPQSQANGGFFLQWAADNYVAASAMAFRRELDTQPGTENLLHMLREIRRRPQVISRQRFRASWGNRDREHQEADRAFDTFPIIRFEDPLLDHLSPDAVETDLGRLGAQDAILEYVQTTVAHRVPERPNLDVPTFGDFHAAVEIVREVVDKYYLLLTHRSVVTYEPVPQYDVFAPFTAAWIPNPEAFDYEAAE
jgi:hypothetical protein